MILVAIFLPPLAVLLKGKPIQALINIFLTAMFWIPGVIHAILVVNAANADKRTAKLEKAIRESAQAQTEAAVRFQQAQAEAQAAAAETARLETQQRAAQTARADAAVATTGAEQADA